MSPRTLLAASLILNVFAVGALGGGTFMLLRPGVARVRPGAPPSGPAAAGQELPPAERARFRTAVRAVLSENRELLRDARDARNDALETFLRTPFDRAAANGALDRARDADFAVRTRLEQAELDFAAALPPEQRALLALGLERGGPLRHSPVPPPPPPAPGAPR